MFAGGDEVLVGGVVGALGDAVELLIELRKLSGLGHLLAVQEEGWLVGGVTCRLDM